MGNKIKAIRKHLRNYRARAEDTTSSEWVVEALESIRASAVAGGDQRLAKTTWRLRQIHEVQETYIRAFREISTGKFFDGWCSLERVEIGLQFLEAHYSIAEGDGYGLGLIRSQTDQFQELFPYRVFFSPAWLVKERRCSICNSIISIRRRCDHETGQIYDGLMCCEVITAMEPLEISMVEDPVQKYSVPFFKDPRTGKQVDHYDYTLVSYVAKGLRNPFDSWSAVWTKARHPHDRFKHVAPNEPCPCQSDSTYGRCCLKESGVLRPHLRVEFALPPPVPLPRIAYSRG
jgi:hypothetical protein